MKEPVLCVVLRQQEDCVVHVLQKGRVVVLLVVQQKHVTEKDIIKEGMGMVEYCQRCVISDQRPGIVINEKGLCSACQHTEYKKTVDWVSRKKQFEKLCSLHKSNSKDNDCIVAVSSGKDSFWQVKTLKDFGMNPLLCSVWNSDWTKTGLENFETMQSVFNCEAINLHTNLDTNRKVSRVAFENWGFPAYLFDLYIYTYPLWMSIKLGIPLLFYGENVGCEYGGKNAKDISSAIDQIKNDVVRDYGTELWDKSGVHLNDIPYAKHPSNEELTKAKTDPRYFSYYFNWSGYQHMLLAKEHGWKSLNDTGEWNRKGWIDDYNQVDDFGYLVDPWMKYPKYGHRQVTDMTSRLIRDGLMTREKAVQLVREHDPILDPISLEHYLKFSGYSEREFWSIVDKFYNPNLFEKRGAKWILKNPVH
jgi:N-acetyl sugar amidotransferase